MRHPLLERLRLLGRDALDEAEELLGVGHVGEAHLAVGGFKFQLVTICHRFISLFLQSLFEFVPVLACRLVITIRQHTAHVHNGEVSLLFLVVPRGTNLFLFK